MSDDTRISEIRARLEAATNESPLPWTGEWDGQQFTVADANDTEISEFTFAVPTWGERYEQAKATCEISVPLLIANAPADIAHLLAVHEQQAARIAALEGERDRLRGWQAGQTHYVGCWREHRQCALTTVDFESARRERAELALREAVEELNRLREGRES